MSSVTPRRSTRIHVFTPKMSERKKGLFQAEGRESLTRHRLPPVESDSDCDSCDLGIISALDCSSSDEQTDPQTPERGGHYATRSHTSRILRESHELKNFLKSPFTLNKYQNRQSAGETKSLSMPATPHIQHFPDTPSSTHSCASVHTTSSEHSKARKSLASLIADTESCSSSLKDLNFNTDSETDSKENTPSKNLRKSQRKHKMTPKYASFKGILMEQKNSSPNTTVIKKNDYVSPSQMLKTPQSVITDVPMSPPKLGHNRRMVLEIPESPDESDNERSHKRLRTDSFSEGTPQPKYLKLDPTIAPKARLSLFNSDRLKEILSTKMFYGKTNPKPTETFTTKITKAVLTTTSHPRKPVHHSSKHRSRKPGQINMGVRHKIRKPKVHSKGKLINMKNAASIPLHQNNKSSGENLNISSTIETSFNHGNEEKADPFDNEKQTIEALLSQWTEEEVPERELVHSKKDELIFNKAVMDETQPILPSVTAVPVEMEYGELKDGGDRVFMELGTNGNGGQKDYLPVDGGYIVVEGKSDDAPQEELLDLDEIDRELQMLDEQILQMAQTNNIDADAVIASTESQDTQSDTISVDENFENGVRLFPIFSKPISGIPATPENKEKGKKKPAIKKLTNQYLIDAGQKKFGATQCSECSVIYEFGDPQDEYDHLMYHNATDILRFNGWKEERVVGNWAGGRCICVRSSEQGWKRVQALLDRLVHPQLGYNMSLPQKPYTAYLYIEKKQIVGCLVVEVKLKANKLIPGDPDCCSDEEYPVKCGVSRVWTHSNYRRQGIACKMLDCMRASFMYGQGLEIKDIAFSAPTETGKALATKYCNTDEFYIYLM